MTLFVRAVPNTNILSMQLNQIIDAWQGATAAGNPMALTQIDDNTNFALTVQNLDASNTRALNVLRSDGTIMLRVDSAGVTLGSPLNLANASVVGSALAVPVDIPGTFRSTASGPAPTSGAGVELLFSGGIGYVQAYDRTVSTYLPLSISGSAITLTQTNWGTAISIAASQFRLTFPTGGTLADGGAGYVAASQLTVTPGAFSCASMALNGNGVVAGNLNVSGNLTMQGTGSLILYNGGYFLAVGESIRYAVPAGGGYHSFESAGGGYAPIVCGRLNATGVVTVPLGYVYFQDANNSLYCDNTIMQFTSYGGSYRFYSPLLNYVDMTLLDFTSLGIANLGLDVATTGGANPRPIRASQFVPYGATGGFLEKSVRAGNSTNELEISAHLWVPGSIWCTNLTQTSSLRVKKAIQSLVPSDALAMIQRLTPFSFEYVAPAATGTLRLTERYYGFAAEDMAEVVPEATALTDFGEGPIPDGIQYPALVPILWGAVQALEARISQLENAA